MRCVKDGCTFTITLFLILGPSGVFLAFSGTYFILSLGWFGGGAIVALFVWMQACVLANLFRTSFSDPGAIRIPRHPQNIGGAAEGEGGEGRRFVRVSQCDVLVKYCSSCHIWRPPRAAHCSSCGECVLNFDHHCPWVGNCVALRNYASFFRFIMLVSIDCLVSASLCVLHLLLVLTSSSSSSSSTPPLFSLAHAGPISVLIISGIMLLPASSLFFYHLKLSQQGLTTREDFKRSSSESGPGPHRHPEFPIIRALWADRSMPSFSSQDEDDNESAAVDHIDIMGAGVVGPPISENESLLNPDV